MLCYANRLTTHHLLPSTLQGNVTYGFRTEPVNNNHDRFGPHAYLVALTAAGRQAAQHLGLHLFDMVPLGAQATDVHAYLRDELHQNSGMSAELLNIELNFLLQRLGHQ